MPVSPWISTVLFIGDTSSSVEKSACIVLWRPMMLSKRKLAFELRLELGVLLAQPLLLEAGLQHARQLRQLERLDEEVHRAAA